MFDPHLIKQDFPILAQPHRMGKELIYLDSAATSQKPNMVIEAITNYYLHDNANVHRGVHELGDRSTHAWLEARAKIAGFLGAAAEELVLVRNTTEALNMVAYTWGEAHVGAGDLIIATLMDHHSNLVPWQELAKRKGAKLELIPVTEAGVLDLDWLANKLQESGKRLKILAFPFVSNTLGTINPVEKIVGMVRSAATEALLVLDAAQAAPHLPVNFAKLKVDCLAVSAHKMLGPMGVGGLSVRKEIINDLKPWLFGGGMIDAVGEVESTFAPDLVDRFTPGTPDVAGTVGWAAACEYLSRLGMETVAQHDREMTEYALKQLSEILEVKIVGPQNTRSGSVAFLYQGVHSHDVAQILDSEGVAVRSGHHCTMPLHVAFHWAATTRASFNVYTTKEDIDVLVRALAKVKQVFGN